MGITWDDQKESVNSSGVTWDNEQPTIPSAQPHQFDNNTILGSIGNQFPSVSTGLTEMNDALKSVELQNQSLGQIIVRDFSTGVEVAHAAIVPILDFLNPIPGLTGIAKGISSGSLDEASKSIESSKKFFSEVLHAEQDYVSPEAHIIRGAMTAGFGLFTDAGKITGDFFHDLTGNAALGATVNTTISLLPLLLGAKPKKYKPEVTPKILEGMREELSNGAKVAEFAKNSLYQTKSELISAFKEAVKTDDVKQQTYLQDMLDKITFVEKKVGENPELDARLKGLPEYTEADYLGEWKEPKPYTEEIKVSKPATEVAKEAVVQKSEEITINSDESPKQQANSGSSKLKINDTNDDVGETYQSNKLGGKNVGIEQAAKNAVEEGQRRHASAIEELAKIEEEIVAIKERAKQGSVPKQEVLDIAKRRSETKKLVDDTAIFKEMSFTEELDPGFDAIASDELNPTKTTELRYGIPKEKSKQVLTLTALKESATKVGAAVDVKMSGNATLTYDITKDGLNYNFSSFEDADAFINPKTKKQVESARVRTQIEQGSKDLRKAMAGEDTANLTFEERQAKFGEITKESLENVGRTRNEIILEIKELDSEISSLKEDIKDAAGDADTLASLKSELKDAIAERKKVNDELKGSVSKPSPVPVKEVVKVETKVEPAVQKPVAKPAKEVAKKPRKEADAAEDFKFKRGKDFNYDGEYTFSYNGESYTTYKNASPGFLGEWYVKKEGQEYPKNSALWTKKDVIDSIRSGEFGNKNSDFSPTSTKKAVKITKDAIDPNELKRQEIKAQAEASAPELVPYDEVLGAKLQKYMEDNAETLRQRKADLDSVQADIGPKLLSWETPPLPKVDAIEYPKDYAAREYAKTAITSFKPTDMRTKPTGMLGASRFINVQQENLFKIEQRTGLPFAKIGLESQVGLSSMLKSSNPFRHRINQVKKGMLFSNAQRIYRLLETHGIDERTWTFERAQKEISKNKEWKRQFQYLTEKEFNAAQELSNILREAGTEYDIPFEEMLKDYAPRIKSKSITFEGAIEKWKQPETFNWWADEERKGYLNPHEEDIFKVVDSYVSRGAMKKYVGPSIEKFEKLTNQATGDKKTASMIGEPELKALKNYIEEVQAIPSSIDKHVNITADKLARKFNALINTATLDKAPKRFENIRTEVQKGDEFRYKETGRDPGYFDVTNIASRFVDFNLYLTYGGALAFRPVALVRNLHQTLLLTYPIVGEKNFMKGAARAMTKEGRDEARAAGAMLDDYLPLAGELENNPVTILEKTATIGMTPYTKLDNFNRALSYHAMKSKVIEEGAKFFESIKTKDDFTSITNARNKFFDEAEINYFHPVLIKNELMPFLERGDLEGMASKAGKLMADETQFIYRRANSPALMRGKIGKLFGQFGTYPAWAINYFTNTVSRGTKTQIAKRIARLGVINSLVQEIGSDVFGVDVSKWLWWHPVMWTGGIAVSIVSSAARLITNKLDGKDYEVAKAASELENAAKLYMPGSLAIQDWMKALDERREADMFKRAMGFKPSE